MGGGIIEARAGEILKFGRSRKSRKGKGRRGKKKKKRKQAPQACRLEQEAPRGAGTLRVTWRPLGRTEKGLALVGV